MGTSWLTVRLQASFVVFMGLMDAIGRNGGGGVHQWNLTYEVAQYNYKVRHAPIYNSISSRFDDQELRVF